MQRREFSRTASALAAAGTFGALVPLSAQAQRKVPTEGTDYLVLGRNAPVEAPAGKVEVVEFFWYSCPHCFRFEPQFHEWTKKAPKDVVVRRVPVSFRPDFEPQQRLYYALEAMGKVEELHQKVFNAIHVERKPLRDAAAVTAWAESQGLDRAKFTQAYEAAGAKARAATQLQDMYQVDGVPALGVAGRYFTSGGVAGSMERALQVTDYLITQARKA